MSNQVYYDPGRRNFAIGGLGVWVIQNSDGTETIYEVADAQLKGAFMANDKLTLVNAIRGKTKAFNEAWRSFKPDLEDLVLLGFNPAGEDPITDADLAETGITATQFWAGVGALQALDAAPTTEQVRALAKLAAR